MMFKDAELAVKLLMPPRDHLAMINAMKNFQIGMDGPDELTMWFMETLNAMLDAEADELCGAQRYERSPDRVDERVITTASFTARPVRSI